MSDDSDSSCDTYVNAAARLKALNQSDCSSNSDDENETSIAKENSWSSFMNVNGTAVPPCKIRKVMPADESQDNTDSSSGSSGSSDEDTEEESPDQILDSISLIDNSYNEKNTSGPIPISAQASNLSNVSDIMTIGSDQEDDTADRENYAVDVKIKWRSKNIERLSLLRFDCFKKVYQYFADRENVPIEQVLIYKADKLIGHSDTPVSTNLSVVDILEGGIVDPEVANIERKSSAAGASSENICKIKVQTSDSKKSILVDLKMNEKFDLVIAACVEKLDIAASSVKLYFDGELIEPTDTPASLDLEQEACVDLKILKS